MLKQTSSLPFRGYSELAKLRATFLKVIARNLQCETMHWTALSNSLLIHKLLPLLSLNELMRIQEVKVKIEAGWSSRGWLDTLFARVSREMAMTTEAYLQ